MAFAENLRLVMERTPTLETPVLVAASLTLQGRPVTPDAVKRWLDGKNPPHVMTLVALSDITGYEMRALVSDDPLPEPAAELKE